MTREQFVDKWRHEISGMVLDGATTQRAGANLALFVRTIMQRVDRHLASMYDQLCPPAPVKAPAVNGAQAPVRK